MSPRFFKILLFAFPALWALSAATGTQTLSIVIYKGKPIDSMKFWHTALFIEYSEGRNVLLHVTGAAVFFEFEERQDGRDVTTAPSFVSKVHVATLNAGQEDLTLRNTIYNTLVNNSDNGWNCQVWIGDDLERVRVNMLLSADTIRAAADGMVDVLIDALEQS